MPCSRNRATLLASDASSTTGSARPNWFSRACAIGIGADCTRGGSCLTFCQRLEPRSRERFPKDPLCEIATCPASARSPPTSRARSVASSNGSSAPTPPPRPSWPPSSASPTRPSASTSRHSRRPSLVERVRRRPATAAAARPRTGGSPPRPVRCSPIATPTSRSSSSLSIRTALGDDALDQVVRTRAERQLASYRGALDGAPTVTEKVHRLARCAAPRATWPRPSRSTGTSNWSSTTAPSASAADSCAGLCSAELDLFQQGARPRRRPSPRAAPARRRPALRLPHRRPLTRSPPTRVARFCRHG